MINFNKEKIYGNFKKFTIIVFYIFICLDKYYEFKSFEIYIKFRNLYKIYINIIC